MLEPTRAPFPGGTREATHLHYCDAGFVGSGDPELDLVRLGAMCGVSNGLVHVASLAPQLRERASEELRASTGELALFEWVSGSSFRREASTCGRLAIGIAGDNHTPLTVLVRDSAQRIVAHCQLEGSGFCPPRALSCDAHDVVLRSPGALTLLMEWWAFPQRALVPAAPTLSR